MAPNYSIHAIPAYMVLAFLPHAYAISSIKKANNGKFNNVNARGVDTLAMYKKSVPAEVFGRYERGKAAHANLMENAPFFIGAVIVGNMMGLSAETMNTAIGSYLALRVAYIVAYINVTSQKYSYVRSLLWAISSFVLGGIFVKAGNKLVAQG
ncbi:hypothetical protein K458DRAFT_325085 [Lentithecium fluviatile CBS 122367]|uniref:Membrane-associated proteins in eicosanoid and glutathione metabolism n=1 Tax=Lentithecium fluviatile CBS 122367 TaxID=1168545 RepID=A0A6G1JM43_9PLEO|nr:hypothetical protein K458DRAFT_325085 [Lentithecium fluviatile CBS 122367]